MTSVTHLIPRIPVDTLAVRLRTLRYELDLSQREAADMTGVPFGVWQGMEIGRGTRNVGRHIAAIAANTGYDRDWLMWGGPLAPETEANRNTCRYCRAFMAQQPLRLVPPLHVVGEAPVHDAQKAA